LREISYLYTHNWVLVYEIISESKLVLTMTKKLIEFECSNYYRFAGARCNMVAELLRKKGAYFVGTLAMTKWLNQFFAILAPLIYMLVIDLP